MEQTTVGSGTTFASPGIAAGLRQLWQACTLAEEVDRDIWEFAIERTESHSAGVSNSDLRWMICQGLIEHAYEVRDHSQHIRQFTKGIDLCLEDRSCFVLTEEGKLLASELVSHAAPSPAINGRTGGNGRLDIARGLGIASVLSPSPTWDCARHQLCAGQAIVKEYKLPSPNQETILATFHEEGWPPRIDDPLPRHPDLDPKRRLHDTIKSLNRNQRRRLIRFMGDGTGEGVRWEWMQQQSAAENSAAS
jgi:hypothetical protein